MVSDPVPVMEARGLTRHFRVGSFLSGKKLHAVDDVDLTVGEREIVALVGESGSGKSTVARLLTAIYRPTQGQILFHGRPLSSLRSTNLRAFRRHVQMVFQDPYGSLNPVYPAAHGIFRALKLYGSANGRQARRADAIEILRSVGLTPADELVDKYPYELSGGQRQRYGFAQALASQPDLIIADEPVSMLDVSIRMGILNLIADLRQRNGLSILYITHDLASARYISDRVMVMYAGQVIETGPTEDVLANPKHPYTQLLLASVPDPNMREEPETKADLGEPPRVVDPGEGCRFRWRCPFAIDECWKVTPQLRPLRPAHLAACHVATADVDRESSGAESATLYS